MRTHALEWLHDLAYALAVFAGALWLLTR